MSSDEVRERTKTGGIDENFKLWEMTSHISQLVAPAKTLRSEKILLNNYLKILQRLKQTEFFEKIFTMSSRFPFSVTITRGS